MIPGWTVTVRLAVSISRIDAHLRERRRSARRRSRPLRPIGRSRRHEPRSARRVGARQPTTVWTSAVERGKHTASGVPGLEVGGLVEAVRLQLGVSSARACRAARVWLRAVSTTSSGHVAKPNRRAWRAIIRDHRRRAPTIPRAVPGPGRVPRLHSVDPACPRLAPAGRTPRSARSSALAAARPDTGRAAGRRADRPLWRHPPVRARRRCSTSVRCDLLLLPGLDPAASTLAMFVAARVCRARASASSFRPRCRSCRVSCPSSGAAWPSRQRAPSHNLTLVVLPPLSIVVLDAAGLDGVTLMVGALVVGRARRRPRPPDAR